MRWGRKASERPKWCRVEIHMHQRICSSYYTIYTYVFYILPNTYSYMYKYRCVQMYTCICIDARTIVDGYRVMKHDTKIWRPLQSVAEEKRKDGNLNENAHQHGHAVEQWWWCLELYLVVSTTSSVIILCTYIYTSIHICMYIYTYILTALGIKGAVAYHY